MGKTANLAGLTFGRITAIEVSGRDTQRRFIWRCRCSSGTEKDIRSRNLVQGLVRSCGCLGAEVRPTNGKRGAHKISGAKSHLYKVHLTEQDRVARRNLVGLRQWRSAIFVMFDFECDLCDRSNCRLEAHHLNSWAAHPEQRFDLMNGVALCRECHNQFHDHMGGPRKDCSKKDYQEFKIERGGNDHETF